MLLDSHYESSFINWPTKPSLSKRFSANSSTRVGRQGPRLFRGTAQSMGKPVHPSTKMLSSQKIHPKGPIHIHSLQIVQVGTKRVGL